MDIETIKTLILEEVLTKYKGKYFYYMHFISIDLSAFQELHVMFEDSSPFE